LGGLESSPPESMPPTHANIPSASTIATACMQEDYRISSAIDARRLTMMIGTTMQDSNSTSPGDRRDSEGVSASSTEIPRTDITLVARIVLPATKSPAQYQHGYYFEVRSINLENQFQSSRPSLKITFTRITALRLGRGGQRRSSVRWLHAVPHVQAAAAGGRSRCPRTARCERGADPGRGAACSVVRRRRRRVPCGLRARSILCGRARQVATALDERRTPCLS